MAIQTLTGIAFNFTGDTSPGSVQTPVNRGLGSPSFLVQFRYITFPEGLVFLGHVWPLSKSW